MVAGIITTCPSTNGRRSVKNFNSSDYITFRPDVDGMRAIAVLSVVLFHMWPQTIRGGYIGVDIFFVISGFLITQDIMKRLSLGKFNIVEFYIRRIRRIFPALFFVLFFSAIAASLLLLPSELIRFAKSLIGATLSISNIVFYRSGGYFAEASEETPLLHTWSLGVEEQFYIVWPLLLLVAVRLIGKQRVGRVLFVTALISLAYSQALLADNPTFSFYMLPSRAWELALGGFIGLKRHDGPKLSAVQANVAMLLGLGLIGFALIWFSAATPFPGVNALFPTIGTALMLYAGQFRNPISLTLSKPILSFVGRLSYPLYLVHWPIIVFSGFLPTPAHSAIGIFFQILLIFSLSYFVLRIIEPPFRRLPATKERLRFWAVLTIAPVVLMLAVATLIIKTKGLLEYRDIPQWVVRAEQESQAFQRNPCLVRGGELPAAPACIIGDPSTRPTVVLWGDSHAAQLIPMFRAFVTENELSGLILTKAGCAPVPDVEMLPNSVMLNACRQFNERVIEELHTIPHLQAVLFAGQWKTYLLDQQRLTDSNESTSLESSLALLGSRLKSNAQMIADLGAVPVVASVAPIGEHRPFTCAARRSYWGLGISECSARTLSRTLGLENEFIRILGHPKNLKILRYIPVLCQNGETCEYFDGKKYGLLDDGHLSSSSVMQLLPELENLLE